MASKHTCAYMHTQLYTYTHTQCPSFFREKSISYTANDRHFKRKCITQAQEEKYILLTISHSHSDGPGSFLKPRGQTAQQINAARCLRHWARPAACRHREHCVTQAALQLCTAIANSCYSTSK